ncbi:MAG: argininosuccinate lyase [Bacteroidales bacterium]|jgi:argininosuccinate lyase|nr:argininosuccinate lyase [Bacteroidales bacterium]MDD4058000.1 argininosuccinate lyase [Bacteroidales bacterium]
MNLLWSKGDNPDSRVRDFTVGRDRELDMLLAGCDIEGSIAHINMISTVGLLTEDEAQILVEELEKMALEVKEGFFELESDVEDIHSQVEINLTKRVGELGKKIHSGRSRNDQVLVDIKLFLKQEIKKILGEVDNLFDTLISLSEKHKDVLMPGYTHSQIAMPSSFGLWLGGYAETLSDDLWLLLSAWNIADQNPLGSAAGYGSSFPLNREMTTSLLGFGGMHYNSVAAQMSRGKCEKSLSFALSSIASTLNKIASDSILFMNGNYAFISFPDEVTTGSSIMPHKKNPDVWELIRGYSNRLQSLPNEISLLTTNLTHGYHRDYQLLKEILFPSIKTALSIIEMSDFMLNKMIVNREILEDSKYDYLFTVEEVNRRVISGMPFRDAYREVGNEVNKGTFKAEKRIAHTHEGSIGNLCNSEIIVKFKSIVSMFSS